MNHLTDLQFINSIEKIEKIDDNKIYINLKGLDLRHIANKSNDTSAIRRVLLKNWYKEGFKYFLVFDIEMQDVVVQTTNQVYQKIKKLG